MFRINYFCFSYLMISIVFADAQNIAPKDYIAHITIGTSNDSENITHSKTSIASSQNNEFRIFRIHTNNATRPIDNSGALIDRHLFVLTRNNLHWIDSFSSQISSKLIAKLDDPKYNDAKDVITDIQGAKWEKSLIFVTGTADYYNIYLYDIPQRKSNGSVFSTIPILKPIHKIARYGVPKSISFVTLGKDLYCLLGANLPDEHRSILRVFKWDHMVFQVIESHANKNHQIDDIAVNSERRIFVLLHRGKSDENATTVQIYHYSIEKDKGIASTSFHGRRIQEFQLEFGLYKPYLHYVEPTGELLLDICSGSIGITTDGPVCKSYEWTGVGTGIGDFKVLQEPSAIEKWLSITSLDNITKLGAFKLDQDVLFVQKQNELIAIISLNEIHTNCLADSLVYISLIKSKAVNTTATLYSAVCIYNDVGLNVTGLRLQIKRINLATVKGSNGIISSARNVTKSCEPVENDWRSNPSEMLRTKFLLQELKEQLLHRRDIYIIQIKELMQKIDTLKSNQAPLPSIISNNLKKQQTISAHHIELDSKTSVKQINLTNTRIGREVNHLPAKQLTIKMATTWLKQMQLKIDEGRNEMMNKRSADNDLETQTITVGELIMKDSNVYKSMPRLDVHNTTKYYYFDRNIRVDNLKFDRLLFHNNNEPLEMVKLHEPPLLIAAIRKHKEILVDEINGISWDNFFNSVYRKSKNNAIKGKLHFKQSVKIKNLRSNRINDFKTISFMTLSTDQTIQSNIFISKFLANDIQTNGINGILEYEKQVALAGQENVIETHVQIAKCIVTSDLTLSEKESSNIRPIVGIKPKDLSQIYNGRVLIKGSLTVNNIILEPVPYNNSSVPIVDVFIDGESFDITNLYQHYWVSDVDQDFSDIKFVEQISTPEILVAYIDSHPSTDFLIIDTSPTNTSAKTCKPITLDFQSKITVTGHVLTDLTQSASLLTQINEQAIRRFDHSSIVFNQPLNFERVIINHMNMDFDATRLFHVDNSDKLCLYNKRFTNNLRARGDLVIENPYNTTAFYIHDFNEHKNLSDVLHGIALDIKPLEFDNTIIFEDGIGADNLIIHKLIDNEGFENVRYDHQFNVSELFANLMKLKSGIIKSIVVKGNATFTKFPPSFYNGNGANTYIKMLNGVNVSEYFSLVVRKPTSSSYNSFDHNKVPDIGGLKTFNELLITSTLYALNINYINVKQWLDYALLKNSSAVQVITASHWSFGKVITNHLTVDGFVNGINMLANGDIIFMHEDITKSIIISSNIHFTSPHGIKISNFSTITANLRCDLFKLFNEHTHIKRFEWYSIIINGNVYCEQTANNSESTGFLHFFYNAVLAYEEQYFNTNITFYTNNPNKAIIVINQANDWKYSVPLLINGYDFNYIISDAFTTNVDPTKPILIYGSKKFINNNIECHGSSTVKEQLRTDNINHVNLRTLSTAIIRRNQKICEIPIRIKITFILSVIVKNLIVNKLFTINGVSIDDLYFVNNGPKNSVQMPSITIIQTRIEYESVSNNVIHIQEYLMINLLNDRSLDYFLNHRVKKVAHKSTSGNSETQIVNGFLTFEHLMVAGDITTILSINSIDLSNIVLANTKESQHITGYKYISGDIIVNGPSFVGMINGIDFMQAYKESIRKNENLTIQELLVHNPYFVNTVGGLIVRESINQWSVNAADDISFVPSNIYDVNKWRSLNEHLEIVKFKQRKILRYIDQTDIFHIISNATNTGFSNNQDDLNQLHNTWMTIDTIYNGYTLDLTGVDREFLCPVQYRIKSLKWPSRNLIVDRETFDRVLTVHFHSKFIVHVKTEFPSSEYYFSNCNFSQSTDNHPFSTIYINQKKVLTMKNTVIESIAVFYMPNDQIYMLLHIHHKSITVLKGSFHQPESKWRIIQRIPILNKEVEGVTNENTVTNAHLFLWQKTLLLVVSNSGPIQEFLEPNGKSAGTSSSRITLIYTFHSSREKFIVIHEIIGEYNIINGLETQTDEGVNENMQPENSFFILILSKQNSKLISTWEISIDHSDSFANHIHFDLYKRLNMNVGIRSVSVFGEHGVSYLSVVYRDGNFEIFVYGEKTIADRDTNQWKSISSGYFDHLHALVPFNFNKKLYIFVLATQNSFENGIDSSSHLDSYPILTMYY